MAPENCTIIEQKVKEKLMKMSSKKRRTLLFVFVIIFSILIVASSSIYNRNSMIGPSVRRNLSYDDQRATIAPVDSQQNSKNTERYHQRDSKHIQPSSKQVNIYIETATKQTSNTTQSSYQHTTIQPFNYISFYDAVARLKNKTSEECVQKQANVTFCLTSGGQCITSINSRKQLTTYLIENPKPMPFLSASEFIFEFEKTLLKTPAMKNINEIPSLELSKLVHVDIHAKAGVISCYVGDVIRIRADLIASNGKARTFGFDDVRGWMVDAQNRRAAANVVDLNNGSYEISFRCLWPTTKGRLYVGVAYPREYLRIALQNKVKGLSRFPAAKFKNGDLEELSLCFSTPNIPWPCLCNFTEWNCASFYCGRPRNPYLTCSDLQGLAILDSMSEVFDANPQEAKLILSMARNAKQSLIQQSLFLQTVTNGSVAASKSNDNYWESLQSCKAAGPRVTWSSQRPRWFLDTTNKFRTVMCKEQKLTTEKLQKCLQNTNVWLFGDSNMRQLMFVIEKLLKPKCYSTLGSKVMERRKWCYQTTCNRPDLNFTLTFNPHEHHIYLSTEFWEVNKEGGVARHIDSIPSGGRHIVIVHYFLHTMGAHLSVAHNRLLLYKAAIQRALARNPSIVFAFRGPHVSSVEWSRNHITVGDAMGIFYLDIIKDVFKDLMDRVIFLDGWGMTIAIENNNFHPSSSVPEAMIDLLLSFVCD